MEPENELAVCTRCGQTIHKMSKPWDMEYDDTDIGLTKGHFYSEWANAFGFPWCPGKSVDLEAHIPGEERL